MAPLIDLLKSKRSGMDQILLSTRKTQTGCCYGARATVANLEKTLRSQQRCIARVLAHEGHHIAFESRKLKDVE